MPSLLLTGATPVQVGSTKTLLKIVTAAGCWRAALEDMGYDVDWRPVAPGEDLNGYDAVMAVLNKPNSIAAHHFPGVMWALMTRPDAVAAVDDWQTGALVSGLRSVARSSERMFRLIKTPISPVTKAKLFTYVGSLMAMKKWPWPVVAPTLGRPDASLLGLPADVTPMDPTAYAKRYRHYGPRPAKVRRWVHASLLKKPVPPGLSWPVEAYGWLDRGRLGTGGCNNSPGEKAQPRLSEPELAKVYLTSWGVLSPAHPHAGSGWWRVRYLMAADAGCVLSASEKEARCLGAPYVAATDPRAVERLDHSQVRSLVTAQRECLTSATWSAERLKDTLSDLLKGRTTSKS